MVRESAPMPNRIFPALLVLMRRSRFAGGARIKSVRRWRPRLCAALLWLLRQAKAALPSLHSAGAGADGGGTRSAGRRGSPLAPGPGRRGRGIAVRSRRDRSACRSCSGMAGNAHHRPLTCRPMAFQGSGALCSVSGALRWRCGSLAFRLPCCRSVEENVSKQSGSRVRSGFPPGIATTVSCDAAISTNANA